jgi:3'-5' exoribonuclease
MNVETLMSLENNSKIEGTYVISDIEIKPFKGKTGGFLSFVLQDKSGMIGGKIWDNAENVKKQMYEDCVISVRGTTNLYNGKNQIIVEEFKFPTEGEFDINDFLVCCPRDREEMFDELCSIFNENLEDKDVIALWKSFREDDNFIKKFKNCPGGKGDTHHSYISGLLEHTLSVVKVCLFYSQHYSNQFVDKNILLFGAFLHDIGKTAAYEYKFSIQMTDIGRLHGHVVTGYYIFLNMIADVDMEKKKKEELIKVFGHMILSHHGIPEFEAVKVPMTQEAILLSHADHIDSDIFHVEKILRETSDSWSKFDNMKDRMFYKIEKTF